MTDKQPSKSGPGHNHNQGRQSDAVAVPADSTRDPALERGERLDTGKTIARGGKSTGDVPGASTQKKS